MTRVPGKLHVVQGRGSWWIYGPDFCYGPCSWGQLPAAHPFTLAEFKATR